MGWISPTGFEAGNWLLEARAYDGEVGTGHFAYEDGLDETHQLRLWLPSLTLANAVRFYAQCEKSNPKIAFLGYDPEAPPNGDWVALIPYTSFPNLTWTEMPFATRLITGIGILLKHSSIGYQRLHEIEVWQAKGFVG